MNLHDLEKKLLAVARRHSPRDQVPYAFEKRVMEHIKSRPLSDHAAVWAIALWRAVAPCFGIMVLLVGWSMFAPAPAPASNDFSQEIDNTVLATATQEQAGDFTW
jgi:hypothetical protein